MALFEMVAAQGPPCSAKKEIARAAAVDLAIRG
jgi:hypothetical protein